MDGWLFDCTIFHIVSRINLLAFHVPRGLWFWVLFKPVSSRGSNIGTKDIENKLSFELFLVGMRNEELSL